MCGNCSTPGGTPAPSCQCGKWGQTCDCDFTDENGNDKTPTNCSRCDHVPTYYSK